MKKVYFLKVFMSVVLAMLLTIGNVFADRGWVKVTHNTTLSVGDTIIIAAADYNKAIGTTQNNNNRAAVDINKVGNQAVPLGDVQMLILQQSDISGAFVLFDPDANGGYLYAAGGGNYMRTTETLPTNGAGDWKINIFPNDSITIVAQNPAITQVYMRYNPNGTNPPIFSCYAITSNVKNAVTIYRYEEVQATTVATPEFTPDGGTYYTPQTVSISCATSGATILYTIDGSEPATNGLVYSTPLDITTTTTVKAVAFVGTDTSYMAQEVYNIPVIVEVADIAAFKAANTTTNTTPYVINGDLTFVFRSGAYMYVKDASAGLLIYDNGSPVVTNQYLEGDVISGGVLGTYTKYNQQVEMVPLMNPAASTQNTGEVQSTVVTMAELLANYDTYDAQLVTIENVTFPNGFTGSNSTTITQGESQMTLYKRFSAISFDTTLAPGTVTSVTGFMGKHNNNVQIYPRGVFDLFTETTQVAEAPVFSPESGTYADSVVITLTCATTGAQIRYTIYGEEPSATSTLYEGPFTLYSSRTVKAKAFMNDAMWEDSPVSEAAYTIVNAPTLSVDPTSLAFGPNNLTSTVNIYSASLTEPITISCNNNDFQLSATSFPANVGNTSFTITYTGFGPAFGMVTVSSGTLSAQIDLVATAQLPAPVITPASGTTDTVITVVMSDDVQGAGIAYTLDGTDPDVYSPIYNQPIILNVPGTYTVKAYAFLEGWGSSDITTATYTVEAPVLPSIDTIIYTVGFEAAEGFVASNVYNNPTVALTGADGHQWGTVYGTPSTNEHMCGAQSMQMRWYTSAANILGYTYTNFDLHNVTYVTFTAKQTNGLKMMVSYSIDGGNTYVGDSLYNITTSKHNYRFNVSETGEYNFVRLKFAVVLPETIPGSTSKLLIDSVVVFGVEGIVADMVETPVITPNSGTFYDAVNATITCATTDAVIRYTTDGTEPTVNSTVYTAPIAISTTTTLKAKAWKEGMEPSFVASVTYNFPPEVANIAAFKASSTATSSTVYKITGDVTFVFRSGRYMVVEDASAALMIYDNNNPIITTTYNEGDVISGGIYGSYSLYHGMIEMVPARNTAAATSNTGTVTPLVATIPTLVSQYSTYESRLVTVENVTFIDNNRFVNGTDTMNYYDNFNTIDNDPAAGSFGSITGFVAIRDGEVRLYPRDDNDFDVQVLEQVATPVFTPTPGEYYSGDCGNFDISISCVTDGATIYYTLDGTEPDENSNEYTNPVTCYIENNTITIKAIAMKAGMLNSEVAIGLYTFTVGIHDAQQQVSIYPNPTSGDVTLDLSGLNARTIELFSANGQLLNTVVPTDETMTLSLNNYAAGIYFVRIHSDKAVASQKIIKR